MAMLSSRMVVLPAFLAVACLSSAILADDASVGVIYEDNWGIPIMSELAKVSKDKGCPIAPERDIAYVERFTKGYCQVIAWSEYPGQRMRNMSREGWMYGFKEETLKESTYVLGQARVVVISKSSIVSFTLEKVRSLLAQQAAAPDKPTTQPANGPQCFVETYRTPSRIILRRSCLVYDKKYPFGAVRNFWPLRKDVKECENREDVIAKVKATPNSVGFILDDGPIPTDVKVIPVSMGNTLPVKLSEHRHIQNDYPLAGTLVFYVHPDKPQAAMRFVDFALGADGSKIAERHGLVTSYMQAQYECGLRLKDMKAGKGGKLTGVGVVSGSALGQLLAVDYVQAKTVVQMQYSAGDVDALNVGMFVSGPTTGDDKVPPARELLLLDDRPGDQAMKVHGEKWNALNPKEYMPAGRAVAIVVPAASKLSSLTLEQVKSVFSGQVKNWELLGVGSGAGGGGAGGAALGKINCYGVQDIKGEPVSLSAAIAAAMPMTAPAKTTGETPVAPTSASQAGSLFRKEVAGMAGVTMKKDTAEACSAVSTDPNGIAFVDLAAIPEKGQSIKIIGIGDPDKAVVPSPETIKNATYPLSQRLYLYVHPKASDTAKDFAKFVATCGQSEASPYTDTVKSVAETYRKNGMIPLAEPMDAQAGTRTGPALLPATLPSATTRPTAALTPAPDKR